MWQKLYPFIPSNGDYAFVLTVSKKVHLAKAVHTNNDLYFHLIDLEKTVSSYYVDQWQAIQIPNPPEV